MSLIYSLLLFESVFFCQMLFSHHSLYRKSCSWSNRFQLRKGSHKSDNIFRLHSKNLILHWSYKYILNVLFLGLLYTYTKWFIFYCNICLLLESIWNAIYFWNCFNYYTQFKYKPKLVRNHQYKINVNVTLGTRWHSLPILLLFIMPMNMSILSTLWRNQHAITK